MRMLALLLSLLLMVFVPAALAQTTSIGPDAAGYSATSATSYSFINIASTGTAVLAGSDDDSALVNLGFSFRFYGQAYTSVCVSSNGLLSFGGCNADFANQDLTALAPTGNFPTIAPLWMDLTFAAPGAGAVYYQTLGAAPSRLFVVQWNNAFPVNASQGFTFQVVLSETSNSILFQYQNVDAGTGTPASLGGQATVGIRDTDGQANGRRLQWSHAAAVLKNNEAILFSPPVPDFSLSVTPATATLSAGDSVTLTVTLTTTGDFSAPVNLSCSGLPTGGSCTFSPNPISSGTSIATVSIPASAPGGLLPVQVTGTSGTLTHSVAANLTVNARGGSIYVAAVTAMPGSTVGIPVVVSTNTGVSFDTIAFAVQVTPNGAAPPLDTGIDFQTASGLPQPGIIDLAPGHFDLLSVAWVQAINPAISGTVTLGKVLVNIPASAQDGSSYTVSVISVSAATGMTSVDLALGPAVTLTVTSISYLVGDVYPAQSARGDLNGDGKYDDAGEFGDDSLKIQDLIIGLRAVTKVVPLTACTDRFDAADSYPVDTATARGGDGKLTITDLIITLRRVTTVDQSRWRRTHLTGCVSGSGLPGSGQFQTARAPERQLPSVPTQQVRIELGTAVSAGRGVFLVPVYLSARGQLSGLAFGVRTAAQGAAMTFVADGNAPKPSLMDNEIGGSLALAWLDTFSTSAGGRTLLGHIQISAGTRQAPALSVVGVSAADSNGRELGTPGSAGNADRQLQ
jgi:hypothetical protein